MDPSAEPELIFATPQDWSAWLAANHASASEVWITYWKKGTGHPSIDWQQAVVEALCWGWIDGIRKSVDDQRFKQRFTPRRAGSIWSRINRDHATRLIAEGRMQPPGLKAVQLAQANGQWDRAYAGGIDKMEPPVELLAALAANPAAKAVFDGLNARNRYAICHRVMAAKKPETRQRKAAEFMAMILRGEVPYP